MKNLLAKKPIVTSLDMIEELADRGVLSLSEEHIEAIEYGEPLNGCGLTNTQGRAILNALELEDRFPVSIAHENGRYTICIQTPHRLASTRQAEQFCRMYGLTNGKALVLNEQSTNYVIPGKDISVVLSTATPPQLF